MQLAFDSDSGIATVTAHGLVTSPWDTNATRAELDVPYQVADSFGFDVDRARPDIADLPVSVPGPIYFRREIEWLLPEGETQFRLLGNPQIDEVIGGTRLSSQTELTAPVLQITEEVQSLAWEFPASDLPDVRRASLRLKRSLPRLRATSPVRRAWEYRGDASARLEPIERIYTQLVADADSDDTSALLNRFNFRFQTGDFEGALADIDAAIARDASADNYLSRGEVHYNLGDFDAALADHVAVADIDPDYTINSRRIELLALLGRADEAVALVDEFAYLFEDPKSEAQLRSYALGFAGQAQEGLDLLRDELSIEPEDAESAPSPSAEPTTSLPSVAPPALSAQGQGAGTDRSPGQAKGKGPGKGKGKGKGSGGTKGDGGGSPGGHGATAPGGGQGNGKAKGHGKAKGQSSSPSSGKTTSPGKTKGPGKAKGPTKSNGPGKSKSPGKSKGHGKAKGHSRH